jgi:hypothetical protein
LQWDGETEDHKQQIVELLQANLQQLDEVRQSIETQGNNSRLFIQHVTNMQL